MQKILLTIFTLSLSIAVNAQLKFQSLDSLLSYAKSKSITLKSGDIKLEQAKKAKLAAVLSVIDPNANLSSSFTDNTKLPVSMFPGEALGGTPGTYKEIQTGIQYNSNVIGNIDLKLLNLQGWENLNLAKINIDLSASNNQLTLKTLYQNIAVNYYNIVSLNQQIATTEANVAIADTLYQIANNKYNAGLVKQQDVNDSKANYLTTEENVRQLKHLLYQYYLSLKILCDIPENEAIEIIENPITVSTNLQVVELNALSITNSLLKEKYALSSYNQTKKTLLPTLALNFNQSYQNYNKDFKPYSGSWYTSQYVGLKLSIPIPNATTIANQSNAKYNYLLAQKNTEQEKIKATLEQQQLKSDYDKMLSQFITNKKVAALRTDSYQKNKNLYEQGLLSLDQTLNSYSAMVNANYNSIVAQVNLLLSQSKININNIIK